MQRFVHLHLHSQYSVLDGAIKLKNLLNRAQELGHEAVAITDHGVMHGAIEFFTAAKSAGIKPIIGCEVYLSSTSRFDKTPKDKGGGRTHHLTLLAQNTVGYKNLCRLVTQGFTEGFYSKPRIDYELLSSASEGLVCLSGCMAGELAFYTQREDLDGARSLIERYLKIFGNRYYLEVQPHQFKEQQKHNAALKELSQSLGLPTVATNDCHYLDPDDHYAQEVLMCISTGKLITDEDRIRHDESRLHFKTAEEMAAGLPDFPEAIGQTFEIAESCKLEFDFSRHYMPRYVEDEANRVDELFAEQARSGLEKRFAQFAANTPQYLSPELKKSYLQRLETEITLILKMGFAGYFLVVSDFIRWAKSSDIPVGPGRGSAAGSLVAYAMSITEVDPLPNKLLFERFLNPDRVSLPDIDIDFCIFGRSKVIEYVCEKYGRDKVAQIVTFGTLKAKAAIKDVGRALGFSYAETDKVAKLIPAPRQGFDYPLEEALKMEKRLKEYAEGEGKQLIELALKLEGLSRHTSTHAAGIVIADRPIVELMPLMVDREDQVVSQYSMSWVEKIGLVKFDFLGLKTLTVLREAVRNVKAAYELDIDLNALPLDDQKTFKLVSSGDTIGVFQLESSGITDMVSRLKPSCFEDLVAILALYRPGPLDAGMVDHYINRKHGREPVRYPHKILEPILSDTYGIILYQEQIMQIARDMAGYTLAEADMLRRAMGKKKPEEMAKQRDFFLSGAKKNSVPDAVAAEVFDQMETFARYGFNRSHSVAYALISYQTAYLKAHYPPQFMAALMTFEMGDTDRTLKNIGDCRESGIEVLPPNINKGQVGFSVVEGKILFGLAAIKGVGEKVVEKVLEERQANGEFKDFIDFCLRVDSGVLNRRTLENFIKSGAFSWTGCSRAELIETLDENIKIAHREKEQKNSNQLDLFSSIQSPESKRYQSKGIAEWPINIKLAYEKEALGFYLSGHPLEKYREELSRMGTATVSAAYKAADGASVTVAGVVTLLRNKNTKKGDRYATFVLEDMLDTIEVIVWPDTYQKVFQALSSEDPVVVTAKVDVSDERRVLVANSLESALAIRDKKAKEAIIRVAEKLCNQAKLASLKNLLASHRGDCRVRIILCRENHSETTIALPADLAVAASEQLSNSVEQLFGEPVMSFR